MDPGLLLLGACAVGATGLLRYFKKRQEGFDVPQVGTYPVTAAQGQQMYNPLSLAADPRLTVPAVANMPADQQTAYVGAVNTALTPTATDTSVPGQVNIVPGTNTTPIYVADSSSIIVKADFCEKMTMSDNPFADAKFKEHCGVCLSSGTTNAGKAFTGPKGLYIDPAAKAAAIAIIADSPIPYTNTKPTLGTCQGATTGVGSMYSFALTTNELQDFMNRVTCQHNKNLDGTCAVCLEDGSYTYVGDTKSTPLKTVMFWVAGTGTLNVTLAGKVIKFADSKTTLVLSSTPVSFKVKLSEDSFLNFVVQAPDEETSAELYGALEAPLTGGGVFQLPLDKILLTDDMLSGKPRRGTDYPTLTTPSGTVNCINLMSGYSKSSMSLSGSLPFFFAEKFPFSSIDCTKSVLQTKSSSASIYGGDPCYRPAGQGPGTWSTACLQNRIVNSGCTSGGTLYKDSSSLQDLEMNAIIKQLDGLNQNQYSDADASLKCNGTNISTPCDAYLNFNVNYTPNISAQCINYLYYNQGAGNQNIGPTYTGPIGTYYSLDAKGNKIFCLPGAGYDPAKNPNIVKKLQRESRSGAGTGRIGIPYVQDFFNQAFQRATNTGLNANLPDAQGGRADSVGRCFANLAAIPVSVTPAASMPNARYVRLSNAYQCLQISQIACYDNQGVNQCFGKPTSYSTTYGYGSQPNFAVDGTMASRSFPQIFHSGCRSNDYFMVDMSAVYPIKKIVYYNRADCCQNRATGILIELLDANKQTIWTGTLAGNQSMESILTIAKPFNI
jgi:hypothetical protein